MYRYTRPERKYQELEDSAFVLFFLVGVPGFVIYCLVSVALHW